MTSCTTPGPLARPGKDQHRRGPRDACIGDLLRTAWRGTTRSRWRAAPAAAGSALLAAACAGGTGPGPLARAGPLPAAFVELAAAQDIPLVTWAVVRDGQLQTGALRDGASADDAAGIFFHAASVTKPVVATAVMRLAEEGRLDIDSPVLRYLPELESDDPRLAAVTVRQLLSHRSGLKNFDGYDWDRPTFGPTALRDFLAAPGRFRFENDPGATFAYADLNYSVLGLLIERVTGQSFEAATRRLSLVPGGATSARLSCRGFPPERTATPHVLSSGRVVASQITAENDPHAPSGGLCITAAELALWADDALGCDDGRPVGCASAMAMAPAPAQEIAYGLGWYTEDVDGLRVASHTGADVGFVSGLLVVPERRISVAILTNSFNASAPLLARMLLDAALGRQPDPLNFPARAGWGRLTGFYFNEEWRCAQLTRTEHGLAAIFQYPFYPYEWNRIELLPRPEAGYFLGSFRGRSAALLDLNGDKPPRLILDSRTFQPIGNPDERCPGVRAVGAREALPED